MKRPRGFTLIEVIVALFVVALGMGALLATLTSSADTLGHLRDKSFAQWIALNRISEVRLATARPGVGESSGEVQYAGSAWRWQQTVSDPGIAGMLRIDVSVGLIAPASAAGSERVEMASAAPMLATAYGFLGSRVAPPNGFEPDWTAAGAAGDGQGQGQGQGPGTGEQPDPSDDPRVIMRDEPP